MRYVQLIPYWPATFVALITYHNLHFVVKIPLELHAVCNRVSSRSASQAALQQLLVGAPPLLNSSLYFRALELRPSFYVACRTASDVKTGAERLGTKLPRGYCHATPPKQTTRI